LKSPFMRVLVVQLHGDYREAYQRLHGGGDEYYYGQRYSVDAVAGAARHVDEVATLCGFTSEPYNEVLAPKVRALGAGFQARASQATLLRLVREYDPTHLVIRTAHSGLLRWAVRNRRPSIAVLAESLPSGGPRTSLRNRLIVRSLNHDVISWVGAYGLSSAHDYARLGVHADKIIPWDFLFERPSSFSVKQLRTVKPPWRVFFVGSLVEGKGVGDLLDALAHLKSTGYDVRLKVVGRDVDGTWTARAAKLGLEGQVDFIGLMPTKTLVPLMREADAVLVPSRHSYSEGFPLTIVHALESCSPLIASDHPMFQDHLEDGVNAVIFPAGDYVALAESIRRLLSDPALYERISMNCQPTWDSLSLPVKFGELVDRWIHDSAEDREWLASHRLTSGLYPALGSR
jgi:glycosyltransferase involved in cell wall biosynthesis